MRCPTPGTGAATLGRAAARTAGEAATPSSPLEEPLGRLGLPEGSVGVAGCRKGLDEQYVVALVVGRPPDHRASQRDGVLGIPPGERPQHLPAHRGEQLAVHAVPLDREPRGEGRARAGVEPLEEPALGPGLGQDTAGEVPDVGLDPGGGEGRERVTAEGVGEADGAAELRERPAERAEGVIGVGEELVGEDVPREGLRGAAEPGEHGPRLAAAGCRQGDAVAFQGHAADQAHPEHTANLAGLTPRGRGRGRRRADRA